MENKRRKSGKPEDTAKTKAFIKTLNYFEENDDEQISVQQLVKKMEQVLNGESEAYSTVYMKQKLMDHLSDEIFISSVDGKADIVTYNRNASVVLREFFERNVNRSEKQQKFENVSTAAKLIKSDIK